ncbi:hypothetical protein AB1Y20_019321 [Prymnesium parvum]|uniref:Uncharacterized protein n=1 Tax=Prymnesium parvum TaxID=97485 RepID=A0AB34JTZ9_PRYPA
MAPADDDPFAAATAALREVTAAQPGRYEQLVLKLLQRQHALLHAMHDELTEQRLWRSSASRQLQDLRDELTRLRAPLAGGTAGPSHGSPSARHQGQLPPMELPPPPSGCTSPSPFETSSPGSSSPTAGVAATSSAHDGPRSHASPAAPRPPREAEDVDALNDAARQRHGELRAASTRQQEHGNFVETDPPRRGRGAPRTFHPHERRAPVLPRSAAAPSGGLSAAPTARTAQPPVASEPAVATGATLGSVPLAAADPSTASARPAEAGGAGDSTASPLVAPSVGASGSPNSQPLRLAQKLWATSGDAQEPISSVALSSNGLCMVSGCADGNLQLWARSSAQGEWSRSLRSIACRAAGEGDVAHGPEVNALCLRGSLLISGAADGAVKAWRAEVQVSDAGRTEPVLYLLRTLKDEQGGHATGKEVMSVAMPGEESSAGSADAKWAASGAQDGHICIWDVSHASVRQRLKLKNWVMALDVATVSADSVDAEAMGGAGHVVLLSGCFDGGCHLWRAEIERVQGQDYLAGFTKWRVLSQPAQFEGMLSVCLCASRGLAAAGSNDGTIRVWRVASGSDGPFVSHRAAQKGICALQWRGSTAEELLAGSEDGVCSRWIVEAASLRQRQAVEVHQQVEVMALACTENGAEVACALSDGSVQMMAVPS